MNKIGVYFSANDKVFDWTIAFLKSFRTYNPDLALYLIPFDEHCEKIIALSEAYKFQIYTDESFKDLEKIGEAFELGHSSYGPYWFRRYAAFWGPLDRFMYLDARQVVLDDLKKLIHILDEDGFDFLHYDCAIDQVYEAGPLRTSLLKRGKGRGFNSGRWASKKGLYSLDEFQNLAIEALKVRNQLNPRNTDQAFINYCCDSRDDIVMGHFAEVLGGYCSNGWAGQKGKIYQENDKYYLWDYGGLDHKKQLFLLHWAGVRLSNFMPGANCFKKYNMVPNKVSDIINSFFSIMKRDKVINQTFHGLKAINFKHKKLNALK